MITLGIDPGMAIMGYGVIESSGNKLRALDYGVVTTSSDMETPNGCFESLAQWKN